MKIKLLLMLTIILAIGILPVLAEEEAAVYELLPPPEETELKPTGDWYGEIRGLPVALSLREDGTYTFSGENVLQPDAVGAWEFRDSLVYLDGETEYFFFFQEGRLSCALLNLVLTREAADLYTPGNVLGEAELAAFDGPWMSRYVLVNGAALPAALREDDTRIYIEETRAALTGPFFGERIVDLAFENGTLIYSGEGISARMEMQEDRLLRMAVEKDGERTVLILAPYTVSALDVPDPYAGTKRFIARCYRYALGREGAREEIEYWLDFVENGEMTIEEIARGILGSDEFRNRGLGNTEKVSALYHIYFDREADEGGLAYWTGMLDQGEMLETIEAGLTGSDEFKRILDEME